MGTGAACQDPTSLLQNTDVANFRHQILVFLDGGHVGSLLGQRSTRKHVNVCQGTRSLLDGKRGWQWHAPSRKQAASGTLAPSCFQPLALLREVATSRSVSSEPSPPLSLFGILHASVTTRNAAACGSRPLNTKLPANVPRSSCAQRSRTLALFHGAPGSPIWIIPHCSSASLWAGKRAGGTGVRILLLKCHPKRKCA